MHVSTYISRDGAYLEETADLRVLFEIRLMWDVSVGDLNAQTIPS